MPRSWSILPIALLLASGPATARLAGARPQSAEAPPVEASSNPQPADPAAPAVTASPLAAQEPAAPPTVVAPPAEALEPGDIRVKAESYSQQEKGHLEARGTVDLRLSDMRILADKADVYETPQPDGSVKRRVVAEGNVVFIRGEERLSGQRAEIDDAGRGVFHDAIGYVEPGVFIEARRVERLDATTYKVEQARFTSCSQPNPRWKFSASSARIEVNDKIIANFTTLRIKGVPAFFLPWFYYPINKDGRATGLMIPSFGYSSYRGFTLGTGFFWAMGRSVDQTFYADYWSKMGQGFGHELRYALPTPSRGRFRTYVFDLNDTDVLDWDLDWNAQQALPAKSRATLIVRKSSNLLFRQRFQENFAVATSRSQRVSGAVEHDLGFASLSAYADATTTSYGEDFLTVNDRLPGIALRRYPRQLGVGGLTFGLLAGADAIRYGNQDRVDEWSRFDLAPTVARPFQLSFLEFNPSIGYRFTRYGKTLATESVGEDGPQVATISGPPMNRTFFESGLEMRGPVFGRVFDTPGSFYSDRFKHTIGPEVSWTYRTRVEDAELIPKFSGEDYYYGTNQVQYALVQRFYAKRAYGPGGKLMPWSFLEWRLGQTYYVQIKEGQSAFDPNYASSAFGPGSQPEHLSPLQSRMRLRPTPDYALDYTLEYDVNFEQLRRMMLAASVTAPRLSLRASWARSLRLSEDPALRTVSSHTLRGDAVVEVMPKRLSLEGSLDWDLYYDLVYQARGKVRYAVQCCGFSVEYTRYNWGGTIDKSWRFNVELAGMSSLGGFLGADATGGAGLGSYR